jgi:endoglycosylceramidase
MRGLERLLRHVPAALLATLVLVPAAAAQPAAPLGHAGRWITDADGRVVILHGVNMVYKRAPFAPDAAGFDADDAEFLTEQGFNTVRLGTIYAGVEPQPGVYDDSYLNRIAATEQMLAERGIFSLLDFHQDMYSPRFQGNGFPDWAVQDDGLPALPQEGFPGNYLVMAALNRAYDHFWANDPGPGAVGLQDRYAAAWRHVAERFRDADFVMGYDPMNEPWPGTVYPTCANPAGCPLFDSMQLTQFTQRVLAKIREVDTNHLIWPEPLLTFDFGAQTFLGAPTDPNTGFNFHDYCLPGAFGGPTGEACQAAEDLPFQNADTRAQSTGEALLLSEFGATDEVATNTRLVTLADQHMVSWQFWHYCNCDDPSTQGPGVQAIVNDPHNPPIGDNVSENKLDVLVRPYPQVVAGTPEGFAFDPVTKAFDLTYAIARADGQGSFETSGNPVSASSPRTEIFIPERQYPGGYDAEVTGGAIASAPNSRTLSVVACPGVTHVTVTALPAGSGTPDEPDCRLASGGDGDGAASSVQLEQLRLRVRPRRAVAGVRTCFRARVRTPAGSPVAGARLRLNGRARRTGARGRRRLCRSFQTPGSRTVLASKAGFAPASARIRVRP